MGTLTRTVVFTDLANYTAKVSRTDREGLRRILADHEALVAPIVARYSGRVVKNLGDSFLILFESATDGLRAALDIQDMVLSSQGAPIRLGMTTGDIEEIQGDAFGDCVNLSARILSKTPSGEIWFGAGTHACMNGAEIPWECVGRFRLKGIAGDAQIYRAVPQHRSWLPEYVANAAKMGNLVRVKKGTRPSLLPPDPVVLLEGFTPGSEALAAIVESLPVLAPSSIWFTAYNISPSDRISWEENGRGLVIGTPQAIEASIQEAMRVSHRATGSDTIVLDSQMGAMVELVMCGLALPSVPLSDVVSSYAYDLLPDGRWVNQSDRAQLRVTVEADGTTVKAMRPGVAMNGRGLAPGEAVKVSDMDEISTPNGVHLFRRSDHGYTGIIICDSDMRLGVANGQTAEVGREPNHPGLAFPDRRGQENIHWCTGQRAARARTGGFTLDRALAGRRQASILVGHDCQMELTPLHRRCPTYVLSPGAKTMVRAESSVAVAINDLVIAGTSVVGIRSVE